MSINPYNIESRGFLLHEVFKDNNLSLKNVGSEKIPDGAPVKIVEGGCELGTNTDVHGIAIHKQLSAETPVNSYAVVHMGGCFVSLVAKAAIAFGAAVEIFKHSDGLWYVRTHASGKKIGIATAAAAADSQAIIKLNVQLWEV